MLNCCCNITDQIVYIPIEMVGLAPFQPRRNFDTLKLMGLAKSIKRYGVLQPISVRFMGEGHFDLAAGERRLKAAKMAGLEVIPSVVINVRDKDAAAICLLENIQRERLSPFEEAEGYKRLMSLFGYTLDDICRIVGLEPEYVAKKLRLADLGDEVKSELVSLKSAEEYAYLIAELEYDSLRLKAAEGIIKLKMDVKSAARFINRLKEDPDAAASDEFLKPSVRKYFKDIRLFTNTIKRAVDIMNESGVETAFDIVKKEGETEINIRVKDHN